MSVTRQAFTPFIPDDRALADAEIPDKVMSLTKASARLEGIPLETRRVITEHLAVINSYYSNLIEGNRTEPHEIRAAQHGQFNKDPAKRNLQLESIAHIEVERWLNKQTFKLDTLYQADLVRSIHHKFYENMPAELRHVSQPDKAAQIEIVPGEWRQQTVNVGQHIAPEASKVPALMDAFMEVYHPARFQGDKKLVAVICAHHRLAWIHPFLDGNGRVGRLFTDTALKTIGLESKGIWCLSRGLARASDQYKFFLQHADMARQGEHDGRGQLSQKALTEYCSFMIDTALDQVTYMSELLNLDDMRQRIHTYVEARNDRRVRGMGELKEIASLILFNAFVSGKLERKTAYEISGMPDRTARRLIAQLKEEGLLMETSSRSPLYWQIPEHAEPWYFPELAPTRT